MVGLSFGHDHAQQPPLLIKNGAAAVTMALALRWVFRHTRWQKQDAKDRRETEEKQQAVRAVVDDLKARIAVKVTEVDKGLKQYELVKRLAEAVSSKAGSALRKLDPMTAALVQPAMAKTSMANNPSMASVLRWAKPGRGANMHHVRGLTPCG